MSNSPAPVPNYMSKVTKTAVKSGSIQDASVWGGSILGDGDFFLIPPQFTVTNNMTSSPNLAGGIVQGLFDNGSASGNKVLNIGTLLIDSMGRLTAGSCINNMALNGTLTVNFLGLPLDPVFDPGQFSQGLLAMGGIIDICGSETKTSWVYSNFASKNSNTITLNSMPLEWLIGDILLIPGCIYGTNQDEIKTIGSISGNVVTLTSSLQYDHIPMPGPQGEVNYLPIGNLTRKIIFQSSNPNGVRGHCMFMKDMMGNPSTVNACHALIKDCGRTDAMRPVTDPMLDANGVLIPGTDDNNRARYSWHSHLQGAVAAALQIWDSLVGCGGRKLIFDNHGSNVNATNLIGYNCQGSCFFTERGNEIGTYTNCLAWRTTGSGLDPDARLADQDFGHSGHGLWLQGPLVTAVGNVCGGHAFSAVEVYTRGPAVTPDIGIIVGTLNGQLISSVPLTDVSNNIGAVSPTGFDAHWHDASSTIDNQVCWGCPTGIVERAGPPTGGLIFTNPILSGPNWAAGSIGIFSTRGYSSNTVVQNGSVGGFELGWQMPNIRGGGIVTDGFWNNVVDFNVYFGIEGITDISSNPTFGTIPAASLGGRTRLHYQRESLLNCLFVGPDPNPLTVFGGGIFSPNTVLLSNSKQLYTVEQVPSYVPFPTVPTHGGVPYKNFPPSLVGLTNAQLLSQYGWCVGFYESPMDAVADPFTNGLIGSKVTQPTWYYNRSSAYPQSNPYTLSWSSTPAGTVTTDPGGPVTLQPTPISLLTRTIQSQTFTFAVDGQFLPISPPPPPAVTTSISGTAIQIRNVQLSFNITASNGMTVNEGSVNYLVLQGMITVTSGTIPVTMGKASAIVQLAIGSYSEIFSYGDMGGQFPASNGSLTFSVS